ncbi:DMT family transporter [Candidatus Nitrosotenuis uzonensis]|uniref:DMT family transporter n=1 Tax=Candidatus Nitrosotenuis uzonensis TaxID=1407055 RepID=UPI0015A6AA31|nr:DMT family transporter [Candidatus Nitrosotenuis uzonensis]
MVWKLFWKPLTIIKSIKSTITGHKKLKRYSIGFLFAILAAILGAMADVLPKPILEGNASFSGLNPIAMVAIIYLLNSIMFTGLLPKKNPVNEVGIRNFLLLIIIGVTEIIATTIFYLGLKNTSAVNSAILGNSDIIFTSIIATIIFREALQRKEYFSYSTILCGSIIIPVYIDLAANNYQISQFVYGDFLIIFAGLFYGIEMNVYRYLSDKIDAKRILQIISFVGGIVTISLVFLLQIPLEFEFEYMPTILISGMLGIGISVLFIVVAIKNIGAVRTILIFSTTTLFGIIFSHIILNEKIISLHLIAFVMVFIGIILLRTKMTD